MKHAFIIAAYIFVLVVGNSPVANAMGYEHSASPVVMMDMHDHETHGEAHDHTTAHCCTMSVGHCESAKFQAPVFAYDLTYSIEAQDRPIDDLSQAKLGPEVDLPPPRI